MQKALNLRFLGEIEVRRGKSLLALPQSKKTRALLAYLVVSGRPHRRERLCSLLWDVADDPRGALRWSLSKLRALVDEKGRARIVADRESVSFDPSGARVDLFAVRDGVAGGIERTPTEALVALADEFRGEFLEGLELDGFLEFQAWCVAEREEARQLQARILRALVERVRARPEEALRYARSLVQTDPLDEQARATLVELLRAAGRSREAEEQYRMGRRVLEELGAPLGGVLERARHEQVGGPGYPSHPPDAPIAVRAPAAPEPASPPPLVGRQSELARLGESLDAVSSERRERVVLITGEPGVGKSRLLAEVSDVTRSRGGTVLEGRAYEVEADRPYGPWIDALRHLGPPAVAPNQGAELALLLPEDGATPGEVGSRERLFGAVVDLLAARAHGAPPVVLALDDLQWCDAASAALLHYAVRTSRQRAILVLLAARSGELADNAPITRALRALRREGLLADMRLGPLGPGETGELARSVAADVDGARVYAESGGNPLFALEAARAPGRRDDVSPTLGELVRERLARLPPEAAHVLRWAAVLGQTFSVERLLQIATLEAEVVVDALEVLERHALIQAQEDGGESGGVYAFAHDVVRKAVHGDLSAPRRQLMHRRVAALLAALPAADETAAELAHHAERAGDGVLAARACVAAGRRCLRLFASAEAEGFVRRGLQHAEAAANAERITLQLELLQIGVAARRPDEVDETARRIERLAEEAMAEGALGHARLGFHLVSWLRWEHGEWGDAQRSMLQAERVSRGGDERERIVAMAEAARCLALLQRDLGEAEALLLEAGAMARRLGFVPLAIDDGLGMLRLHQGRYDEARERFEQARATAERAGDHEGEFQALAHLVALEIERERWQEADRLVAELCPIATRLRGGSEGPFARALAALCARAAGSGGEDALARSIEELRVADAKHRLAFVLGCAAELDLRRGEPAAARAHAAAALAAAEALDAPSDLAHARAVLARAARALGEETEAAEHLAALGVRAKAVLSARARAALDAAVASTAAGPRGKQTRRRSSWRTSSRNASSTTR